MKRHFTKYYQLLKLCQELVNQPEIVDSSELELLVENIAVTAMRTIAEQRDDYLEFIHQPKIWKHFDKWIKENK